MHVYDIVIVGSGPAGMTAAIYAIRANMDVLLLDKLAPGGQMINTNEVENYTGTGTINGAELSIKMFEHTKELGVAFDYKTVLQIEELGALKVLYCAENSEKIHTKAVILATGTVPRRLDVLGEAQFAGKGINWCAICDGAQFRGKDVVVIGGGNSAVEESLYLASIANKLTVITLFDLTADPKACAKLKKLSNVKIYTFHNILEFTGDDTLKGVRFISTQKDAQENHVNCDGVFEYIGFKPMSESFNTLDILDSNGCIQVDEAMKTAIQGVFGAGDIINKKLRQIITACSDGAIAANTAAKYIEALKD